ncbi:MAG: phosphoribosylglycinamide formyltransferase [Bacteroidales bacterium]|nr:phosphoribosylglycinamide formyltransferase [Bacteroidales bacterium]
MARLAIFASGNGSNAQRITEYFTGHPTISINLILSNRPDAYVLHRAEGLGIPARVFNRTTLYETSDIPALLMKYQIDFIILAGFLWLIPQNLLTLYTGRIINIHPALLPKYGGKGMYGMKVHEAVIASGEHESGITVHYVDENYDEGQIIFQAKCIVSEADTPESLASRIHELEYRYFPEVIEKVVTSDK